MGSLPKGWRKAYGAIKDSTTVSLAKVNSEYKVLPVVHFLVYVVFFILRIQCFLKVNAGWNVTNSLFVWFCLGMRNICWEDWLKVCNLKNYISVFPELGLDILPLLLARKTLMTLLAAYDAYSSDKGIVFLQLRSLWFSNLLIIYLPYYWHMTTALFCQLVSIEAFILWWKIRFEILEFGTFV